MCCFTAVNLDTPRFRFESCHFHDYLPFIDIYSFHCLAF